MEGMISELSISFLQRGKSSNQVVNKPQSTDAIDIRNDNSLSTNDQDLKAREGEDSCLLYSGD
jgi:hypothetical protein